MGLRLRSSIRLAARCILMACAGSVGLTNDAHASTRDSTWRLAETEGQCDVTTPLYPSLASQFVVGLSKRGTHLTLQSVRWRLPANPTNSMAVKFSFDHDPPIETDALVIAFVGAFQIFIPSPAMTEGQFWHRFLNAKTVHINRPFSPGSVEFKLKDAKEAVALLRVCAQRQLPGQPLPFDFAH